MHFMYFLSFSTIATTVTPANDSCCMIECTGPVLSKEEVDEKIVELERNLTISKRHTAKARRKNISANDERHSATAVGSCCGIVVLALVGSFIILMDIDHVIRAYYLLKAMLSKRVQSV